MSVSYKNLTTDRQWKSSTGLSKKKFRELSKVFKSSFIEIFGKELRDRQVESSKEAHLKNYEEYLFFVLFSLKSGLTYDNLGFVFGMSGGNAKKIQTEGVQILQMALNKLKVMPQRVFNDVKEFKSHLEDEELLKIDGTEQSAQRPVNEEDQKVRYSGKKKTYGKDDSDKQ